MMIHNNIAEYRFIKFGAIIDVIGDALDAESAQPAV
jgi:hypothetical protein